VWLIAAAIFAGLWIVMLSGGASRSNPVRSLPFSGFESAVSQGQIKTAAIAPDGVVHGLLTGGQSYTSRIPTALADPGVAPYWRRTTSWSAERRHRAAFRRSRWSPIYYPSCCSDSSS
jgi:hypothetical protein